MGRGSYPRLFCVLPMSSIKTRALKVWARKQNSSWFLVLVNNNNCFIIEFYLLTSEYIFQFLYCSSSFNYVLTIYLGYRTETR